MFINFYLKEAFNGNIRFWNNLISPFQNIVEKQKLNLRYSEIFNYYDEFDLLVNVDFKLKDLYKTTPLLKAIE